VGHIEEDVTNSVDVAADAMGHNIKFMDNALVGNPIDQPGCHIPPFVNANHTFKEYGFAFRALKTSVLNANLYAFACVYVVKVPMVSCIMPLERSTETATFDTAHR
jgi:hypothetical protein